MTKIAIYGAGSYGSAFLKALSKENYSIEFFIDQYSNEKSLEGIPIYRTDNVKNKDILIFISVSLNNDQTIPSFLKENGFLTTYSFSQSIQKYPIILKELMKTNILWMRENNENYLDSNKINKVSLLLSDNKSKKIYSDIINFRKTLNMNYYTYPDSGIQYFPSKEDINLFEYQSNIKFIDCGAFIGDTIMALLAFAKKNKFNLQSTYSFEADQKNIEKLNLELLKQKELFSQTDFIIFPAGVWSENTILSFSNDGNSASSICSNDILNAIQIPVYSIDSTLYMSGVNYIKMDIEGAEKEAIQGAAETIKRYSPVLAICLYPKPKDLWEIPLLINNINPNYDMYIRVYGHLGLETVLYCIPKKEKNV